MEFRVLLLLTVWLKIRCLVSNSSAADTFVKYSKSVLLKKFRYLGVDDV